MLHVGHGGGDRGSLDALGHRTLGLVVGADKVDARAVGRQQDAAVEEGQGGNVDGLAQRDIRRRVEDHVALPNEKREKKRGKKRKK